MTTAVVWNRAFDMEGPKEVYVDQVPPRAVLAVCRPPWAEGGAGVAMHAIEPRSAQELMSAWPKGDVFLHLSEEWMLPLVEPRAERFEGGAFWLFELDRADFNESMGTDVRPLDARWGDTIGKIWDPTWERAGAYVAARIAAGHAYAVYDDGQPIAWAFLHFETPTIAMMGFLHVLEPYRRRGYARAVASALAKDILDRGKVPALHVAVDNVASLEFTASLGFHRVKKQVWAEAVIR